MYSIHTNNELKYEWDCFSGKEVFMAQAKNWNDSKNAASKKTSVKGQYEPAKENTNKSSSWSSAKPDDVERRDGPGGN